MRTSTAEGARLQCSDGRAPQGRRAAATTLYLFLRSVKLEGWTARSLWRGRRLMTARSRPPISELTNVARKTERTQDPQESTRIRRSQATKEPNPSPGQAHRSMPLLLSAARRAPCLDQHTHRTEPPRPVQHERTRRAERPKEPKSRTNPGEYGIIARQTNPEPEPPQQGPSASP